ADVIKVEERGVGDPGRGMTRTFGTSTALPGGRNYYFETNNRNKRSIAVDLKNERGREVMYRMIENADVFVHNFRQRVPERLGLGYETLSLHNPRLIYAVASGYGPDGDEANRPSIDPVGVARTGLMENVSAPGAEAPTYPQGGIADQMGAVMLSYGVLAALMARQLHGVGQKIDCSHLASVTWLQGLAVNCYLMLGKEMPRYDRAKAGNPISNYYRCADGKWLFIALMQPDRYWPDFCQAIGLPEMRDDSRFNTTEARTQNKAALIALLNEVFSTRTTQEWVAILKDFPDFIFETINRVSDLDRDPQFLANDYIVEVPHPDTGKLKMVGIPVKFSDTPGQIRMPAPQLGQHTEEVLTDICGFSWEEVGQLAEQGVI
ncbi:MAG: CoA transferase, partial [Dehalococcoidia bacterium]|nr:CoA transferase [Dehalococcoidia bacterium]